MPIFVGLDCGGSTSRVMAVDGRGDVLFRGQSGAANLLATPKELLERNLRRATAGCPSATHVCGAFAGLVGPTERERALALLGGRFPDARLRAEPDYAAAHAAATEGTAITVLAGTGSLVCGLDAESRMVKSGGWGYLLGDDGSGFRYGRAFLARLLRHPDEATEARLAAVESVLGAREPAALVAAVYGAANPQPLLARLLFAFAADLDAGAAYAERFAREEGAALAEIAARYVETMLPDRRRVGVSLAGGVWKANERFESLFAESLAERLPDRTVHVERLARPPVQGAVALAREL